MIGGTTWHGLSSRATPSNLATAGGTDRIHHAWQTTAKTGPEISLAESQDRYVVNSLGFALHAAFPRHNASLDLRVFKEFSKRSTFQGYSVQIAGSIGL